jgi:spore coat protein A, manganese oxidase
MDLSRRDLLKLGVLASASLYLPLERFARAKDMESLTALPTPFTAAFQRPPDLDLRGSAGRLEVTMRQVQAPILGPGRPQTNLWAYTATDPKDQTKTLINPTIHVDKGQPIEVAQVNGLPARHPVHGYESWVSVHLHGSASLPQYDGYANDVIKPGQRKVYKYPNAQGARTLWYHDHGVHRTAKNAYAGLAAQYHLHDQMEKDSGIPTGQHDIPLILRDALFARDGSLLWDDNSESSLMGDVILVNGVPWPVMQVEKRRYRFRILNASLSRSFKLSVSDPRVKMTVIATDGGFMPKPVQVSSLRIGMAERYEVILDFTGVVDPLGAGTAQVVLQSAEVKNNVDFAHTRKIMKFNVARGTVTDTSQIPSYFYTPTAPKPGATYMGPEEVMGLTEAMATKRRTLRFERNNGMWTVNGATWDSVMASGYTNVVADPAPGSIEVWDFVNTSGGWFHPIHVHLIDFKILSRNGRAPFAYEQGPKDVAYVGEGETVRMVAKFGPHEGKYMIHCHNLVHEDHDMMQQFRVGPEKGAADPNHPVNAAPAV